MLERGFLPHRPRRQWTAILGRRKCGVCGRRWPCTIARLRQDAINALRSNAA
jgi:hypothetical protein